MLLLSAQRDYNLSSIDVTQAYLQADLTGDLYMRPPPDVHAFVDYEAKLPALKLVITFTILQIDYNTLAKGSEG